MLKKDLRPLFPAKMTAEVFFQLRCNAINASMDDHHTPVADLRHLVRDFVDARQWKQFHSPKNLSMALAIEAAELMEHFQWISTEESRNVPADHEKLQAVGEELADVFAYAFALANELDLDVTMIVTDKMKRNEAKYPAEEYRGR